MLSSLQDSVRRWQHTSDAPFAQTWTERGQPRCMVSPGRPASLMPVQWIQMLMATPRGVSNENKFLRELSSSTHAMRIHARFGKKANRSASAGPRLSFAISTGSRLMDLGDLNELSATSTVGTLQPCKFSRLTMMSSSSQMELRPRILAFTSQTMRPRSKMLRWVLQPCSPSAWRITKSKNDTIQI